MGLAERRAVKEFEDKSYPELKKAIEKAAGFAVPVEVRWDSLAIDDMSHLYAESFPKVYFSPIINALKNITVDDMGRKALKSGLKKIVICNTADKYGSSAISFEGGTLSVDHAPCTNIDSIDERTDLITKMLEKSL